MKKIITFLIVLLPVLLLTDVFIWHNENPTFVFFDPEDHQLVGGDYGIKKALDSLDVAYQQGDFLPADLSEFDAVFVLLGSFCES